MATRCVWCGVVVDTSDRRKMRKHLGEKCRKYPGREELDCLRARVVVLECLVEEHEHPTGRCVWEDNADGFYETTCKQTFIFEVGSSKENGFKYCPFCGLLISEKPAGKREE